MSDNSLNLKQIESKAWRSVFQDGFWDIYLGMLLASMGLTAWLEHQAGLSETSTMLVYVGIIVVAMAILWAGKRFVTVPRIGQVRFSADRRLRRLGVSLILGVLLLLGIVLIPVFPGVKDLQGTQFDLRTYFPALWLVGTLIAGGLIAYLFEFNRLYVITVLFAITVPLDYLIDHWTGLDRAYLAFGIPGLIVVGMGLFTLARFLKAYPRLDREFQEEAANGGH